MNGHKALDIPCEGCAVQAGERCPGYNSACQTRINNASRITRERNKAERDRKDGETK